MEDHDLQQDLYAEIANEARGRMARDMKARYAPKAAAKDDTPLSEMDAETLAAIESALAPKPGGEG